MSNKKKIQKKKFPPLNHKNDLKTRSPLKTVGTIHNLSVVSSFFFLTSRF